MQSVGERLRAARLHLGLSLEQVSAQTRIPVKNLRAIEADELTDINSAFFYRSFVRQFADFLKIEYNSIAPAVQAVASTIPEPLVPGQANALLPKLSRMRPKRSTKLRWALSLGSLGAILIGCSAVYGLWQNSKQDVEASIASLTNSVIGHPAKTQPQASHSASPPPATHSDAAQTAASTPAAPPVTDTPSEVPPSSSDSFQLKVSALEATWLSVVADGKQIFTGVLRPSETKVLEGHETARLRTGNAGGLSVEFNGKQLGSIGPHGQVRTVVFTRDTYEIVSPPPHVALAQFSPEGE